MELIEKRDIENRSTIFLVNSTSTRQVGILIISSGPIGEAVN